MCLPGRIGAGRLFYKESQNEWFGEIMRPETKNLLCRFDEPGAYEYPIGFDYPRP
jgi:hypothetical protein